MSTLKRVLNVSLILLAFVAIFSSCQKDDITPDTTENTTNVNNPNAPGNNTFFQLTNNDAVETDSLDECFTFNFPLTVNIPGEGSQEVNSEDELWDVIEAYFENGNGDFDEFPTIEFPIEVTLADGTTQTVNDDEELCDLYHECYGDDEWDDDDWDDDEWGDDDWGIEECFTFVYPITIELEDGSTVEVASEDAWEDVFEDLGDFEYFELVYPITIEYEDGTTEEITDEEGMEEAYEECYGDYEGDCDTIDIGELCFEFVFPLDLILPDGSTVEVNDEESLFDSIIAYYEANPNSDEDPTFGYPIDVTLEDGTTQTVNNDDELEELFEECFGDGWGLQNPNVSQGMSRMNNLAR